MELYNSSMGHDESDTIELTLEQYEEAKEHFADIISKSDAAKRLADNDDFNLLVMVGYFVDEPQRYAELMASGRLNDKVFSDCADSLEAIGKFRNYLKNIIEQGHMARDELAGLEEARDLAIKAEAGE